MEKTIGSAPLYGVRTLLECGTRYGTTIVTSEKIVKILHEEGYDIMVYYIMYMINF